MKGLKIASEAGRHTEQVRRDDPGAATARRGPNWFPGRVQATRRDHAAGDVERSDHDPDGGRPRRVHVAATSPSTSKARPALAEDRVPLFRLAWDMSISAFGGRQSHYELFFFGDPPRMKQALYGIYDTYRGARRVKAFVADTGWPQNSAGVTAGALA